MLNFRRHVLTGLLTIVPLWITGWVMLFLFEQIVRAGRPLVVGLSRAVRPYSVEFAELLTSGWFQSSLAVVLVVGLLFLVGAAASFVIGRRLIGLVDRIMDRLPIAKTIYGATRTLLDSVRGGPQNGQRVVLIEFPTPEMRAVGFVTSIFKAADTGEEVAAVYVPTTPNPTSGYVEIVPVKRIVWLNWTPAEAASFIVSGGAMGPKTIPMNPPGHQSARSLATQEQ
jgi:uncharacterized membrane protein